MPLPVNIRKEVVNYVLKGLVPVTPNTFHPHPTPLGWFQSRFDFVLDSGLKHRLGEAYYQARYLERVREALGLKEGFNHAFIQFQIVQYASIYEAVIDYKLGLLGHLAEIERLVSYEAWGEVKEALGSQTKVFHSGNNGDEELILCRKKKGKQKLKEIQFSKRLRAAAKIGLVPLADEEFINKLYENRNCLHLINATEKEYKPLIEMSDAAFERMKKFLSHVKSWAPKI